MRDTFSGEVTRTRRANNALAFGVVVLALLFGLVLTAKPAHAKTFTVTNIADPGDGICSQRGGCTLREAINAANSNDIAP